jgi:hypothetical protein
MSAFSDWDDICVQPIVDYSERDGMNDVALRVLGLNNVVRTVFGPDNVVRRVFKRKTDSVVSDAELVVVDLDEVQGGWYRSRDTKRTSRMICLMLLAFLPLNAFRIPEFRFTMLHFRP